MTVGCFGLTPLQRETRVADSCATCRRNIRWGGRGSRASSAVKVSYLVEFVGEVWWNER